MLQRNIFLQIIRDDHDPFILELVNLEGETLRHFDVSNELDFYEFRYLEPGNYLFRYIKDKNGNKKWDTGNYLKKLKPEMVFYSPDTIELRANWEINQQLKIPSTEFDNFSVPDSMGIDIKKQIPQIIDSLEISN